MRCFTCLVFSACFYSVVSQQYDVPEATLEILSPRGLRISIPGNNLAVKRVSFHVNINQKFHARENGQYSADTTKLKNGRWEWVFPQFKVKQGDVIYYWVYVVELSGNGINSYSSYGSEDITEPYPHNDRMQGSVSDCVPSETTTRPRRVLCQGAVILIERFNSLDRWTHQVTVGGTSSEDEFMVFMKEPYTNWVDGGTLFIKPSLLESQYNETFVITGELDLSRSCTSSDPEQCHKQASSFLILPPILSARLSTRDKFSFRYGTVEIRAKLPRGKWIVPELWLEPVNGLANERVVLGMSRGNADNSDYGWRTLEAGVVDHSQTSINRVTEDTPWAEDFHTFKLHWTPYRMEFFVDNQVIHRVSSTSFPIVDKEAYITLGVHVAGNKDFPDSIRDKPWKNSNPKRFHFFWLAKDSWYPSWGRDATLQVESIKITAL